MVLVLTSFHPFVWRKDIPKKKQPPLGTLELWDPGLSSKTYRYGQNPMLKNCDVEIMLKGGGKMKG